MGETYKVTYRPALTVVRFTGTTTVTTDQLYDDAEPLKTVTTTADAAFFTAADWRSAWVAEFTTGSMSDVTASLALTPDQRLTSATADSTGHLGTAVGQVLGAAATVGTLALAFGLETTAATSLKTVSDSTDAVEKKYAETHTDEGQLAHAVPAGCSSRSPRQSPTGRKSS
jgi:hypothetical protein